MKITGFRKKGRHLLKNVGKDTDREGSENSEETTGKRRRLPKGIWKKALIGVGLVVAVTISVLAMDVFMDLGLIIKPPPVDEDPRRPSPSDPYDPTTGIPPPVQTDPLNPDDPATTEEVSLRKPDTFTFLVFGIDSQANTDVIMTVTFDTQNHTFNVASIPRDTLTNVEWNVKKANQIVYNMRRLHRGEVNAEDEAMKDTKQVFADILGYRVDYWITVDLRGFAALIDAIGGVDFYIPVNMEYHDPAQNLHISYTRGMKRGLTGQQALEIIRFRMGYANKDIGRIETQQKFLKAAADQILAKKSSINVATLAEIFLKHVKTDLALNHIIWLGLEFMKLDSDDVNFVMMPGNNMDSVNGSSYVTIYVEEWLEIINSMLNPLVDDITVTDVSILTRGADRKLYVTDGNRQGDPSWGASSRGPSTSSSSGGGNSSGNPGTASPSPTPGGAGDGQATDPPDVDISPGEGPGEPGDPPDSSPTDSGEPGTPEPSDDSSPQPTAPSGTDAPSGDG